jgi:hypothetical protein
MDGQLDGRTDGRIVTVSSSHAFFVHFTYRRHGNKDRMSKVRYLYSYSHI